MQADDSKINCGCCKGTKLPVKHLAVFKKLESRDWNNLKNTLHSAVLIEPFVILNSQSLHGKLPLSGRHDCLDRKRMAKKDHLPSRIIMFICGRKKCYA